MSCNSNSTAVFVRVETMQHVMKARTNLKTWSNPWFVLLRQQESEGARILGRRNTGNTALTFTIVLGHLPPPSESHYSSALHNETSTASSRPSSSPQLSSHLSLLWLHTPLSLASLILRIYDYFPQWNHLRSLTCPFCFKWGLSVSKSWFCAVAAV